MSEVDRYLLAFLSQKVRVKEGSHVWTADLKASFEGWMKEKGMVVDLSVDQFGRKLPSELRRKVLYKDGALKRGILDVELV